MALTIPVSEKSKPRKVGIDTADHGQQGTQAESTPQQTVNA
jgi:hypothetical protein